MWPEDAPDAHLEYESEAERKIHFPPAPPNKRLERLAIAGSLAKLRGRAAEAQR